MNKLGLADVRSAKATKAAKAAADFGENKAKLLKDFEELAENKGRLSDGAILIAEFMLENADRMAGACQKAAAGEIENPLELLLFVLLEHTAVLTAYANRFEKE